MEVACKQQITSTAQNEQWFLLFRKTFTTQQLAQLALSVELDESIAHDTDTKRVVLLETMVSDIFHDWVVGDG
jgi:hypothetical protein